MVVGWVVGRMVRPVSARPPLSPLSPLRLFGWRTNSPRQRAASNENVDLQENSLEVCCRLYNATIKPF